MSSLERSSAHLRVSRPVALQLEPGPRQWRAASISWRVGADALKASSPELAAAVLADHAPAPDEELTLTLRLSLGSDQGIRAELTGPRATREVPLPAGLKARVEHDDALALVHIDAGVGSQTLLRATLRLEEQNLRLLYCRTSLIASLGLAGGRYEPHGAEDHDR